MINPNTQLSHHFCCESISLRRPKRRTRSLYHAKKNRGRKCQTCTYGTGPTHGGQLETEKKREKRSVHPLLCSARSFLSLGFGFETAAPAIPADERDPATSVSIPPFPTQPRNLSPSAFARTATQPPAPSTPPRQPSPLPLPPPSIRSLLLGHGHDHARRAYVTMRSRPRSPHYY